MSAPLLDIQRNRCALLSGVKRVKLVIPSDVTDYNDPNAEAGIEVAPGAKIYHIEIDPGTGGAREELAEGDHGDFHNRQLNFQVRGTRQEVTTLRARLQNRRVHVIFTSENDLTYLYLYIRLRRCVLSEPPRGGKAGYTFSFSGAYERPANFVQGVLLPAPTGDPISEGDTNVTPDLGGNEPDLGAGDAGLPGDGDIGGEGDPPDTGDGGDPPDPPVATNIIIDQPSSGHKYTMILGPCEEPVFTRIPQ